MTILDEQYAEFERLPNEERIKCFEKGGRLYDMIISQQLNARFSMTFIESRTRFAPFKKQDGLSVYSESPLSQAAMLYFAQPSSRRFLSF